MNTILKTITLLRFSILFIIWELKSTIYFFLTVLLGEKNLEPRLKIILLNKVSKVHALGTSQRDALQFNTAKR